VTETEAKPGRKAEKANLLPVVVMAEKANLLPVVGMAEKAPKAVMAEKVPKVMPVAPGHGNVARRATFRPTQHMKAGRSRHFPRKARILTKSHEFERQLLQHFLSKMPVACRPAYPENPDNDDARPSNDPGPPVAGTTGLREVQTKVLASSPAVFMVLRHLAVDWASWAEP
ncbi:unnamed protein product, partial [Symbiodinium sp. CCMP2592]